MTIANAVAQGPKGYLFADTAWIDSDTGTLIAKHTKIFRGRHFPWAVAVTADGDPLAWAHAMQDRPEPRYADELRKWLVDVVNEYEATTASRAKALKLLAVAWDGRAKRSTVMMASTASACPDFLRPYEIAEGESLFGMVLDMEAMFGREVDFTDPRSFDPETDGLKPFLHARRAPLMRQAGSLFAAGACGGFGGEVEMAEISRRGVRLWRLHDFGDVVGAPIPIEGAPALACLPA